MEERNVFVKPRAEPSLLELCYGEKTKDEIQRIFDDMNNGFGWDRLPKSFMAENTVFLLLTALIRNFYKAIIQKLDVKKFGLNATSRIKAFVFRFISVPVKWIRTSRGMCWISIPVIMLTQMFSRLILDNAYNLWE